MISYNFKLITTTDIYKINLNAFLDDEDNLYVLFESAGEKYLEGTDGKGQSLSPIDKLLIIPLKDS